MSALSDALEARAKAPLGELLLPVGGDAIRPNVYLKSGTGGCFNLGHVFTMAKYPENYQHALQLTAAPDALDWIADAVEVMKGCRSGLELQDKMWHKLNDTYAETLARLDSLLARVGR